MQPPHHQFTPPLAALAIERQAELHSTDQDFARFSGLRWRNPLAS